MSSAANNTARNKLAALVASPAVRLDVHRRVRQAFRGFKALCAATVSEYLIRASVLSGYRPWTSQLESALKQKGWQYVRAELASAREGEAASDVVGNLAGGHEVRPYGSSVAARLQPLDICYTVDSNRNGAPDHVFIFIRWLDMGKLVAEVIDNYSAHPHPRNIGAPVWYGGKRLAYGRFTHAQRSG